MEILYNHFPGGIEMNSQDVDHYRAAENRLWDHYGARPVEHFFPVLPGGGKVRVLEVGQGEPVLFLHGSPNAGSKWAPLAARLTGFRCLILDRPGCGLSDPLDYADHDLRVLLTDPICRVLDALDLPQVKVVASSLGGWLALHFAQANPARVTRLVLEGCPAFIKGFRMPIYNLYGTLVGLVGGRPGPSLPAFRHMGHAAAIDAGKFELEVLTWRDALLRYTDTARNENALNRHLTTRMGKYTYDETLLRRLPMPTLYLWGESDPFGGAELGRRMASAQPDARITTFPASGHLPWLDDVETHVRMVEEFLK
jgi:pimeloyl-ACP methyl ester carboxylesterase